VNEWVGLALIVIGLVALFFIWRESKKAPPYHFDRRMTAEQRRATFRIQKREER
jgi:hypothetical protein